jgi:hypothetical protein
MPRPAARLAVFALTASGLVACAEVPSEPTTETVDETTGVTVARLAHPIELLAASGGAGSVRDPFAYLAPFETNRMGERALFLWMATPEETPGAMPPQLVADGQPLALTAATQGTRELGLSTPPYARPAPWNIEHTYVADRALLDRIAGASVLELVIRSADGSEQRYAADAAARAPLLAFVAGLQ